METRYCSFCGSKIEYGTGKMFIKRDGSVLYFDNSKCETNFLKLHREPRRVRWTASGREEKAKRLKFAKPVSEPQEKEKSVKKEGEESKVEPEPVKEG